MKQLHRLFDKLRPNFEEGGKLNTFVAVFEALENFFFAPSQVTVGAPHVRDPLDLKRYMSMVIVGLVPAIIAGLYFYGLRIIPMIVVSYAAGGAVEVAFAAIRKEEIHEGFLVTGMIFPLVLPPTLPLWMVAVGVAFGVLVGKELFGGVGRNVFNPAIVGRVFLALAYPAAMTGNWVEPGSRVFEYVSAGSDAVTAATPLGLAKQGAWDAVSVWDLFIGRVAGCVGESSALAILIGGVILLLTKVGNYRTVVGMLGAAAVSAALFHQADSAYAPMTWHLFAGGLMFGAFYMATDPVSSAATNAGKWIYGILIGVVTVLIRNLTGYVEGVMFAILLGNIAAPIIDEILFKIQFRRLQGEG